MKNKLFAFAMVALMLAMLFAVPMPITATKPVVIYVAPDIQEYWAPCMVSTEFFIEIKIDLQDTGYKMYAFDFNLTWSTKWINLTKIEVLPPWPEGKYYIVVNDTAPDPLKLGRLLPPYQLAITALDTADHVEDKVAVVRLTFHISDEPCWPDIWTEVFDIYHDTLVSCTNTAISHETYDGSVVIHSSKPVMGVVIPEGKFDEDNEIWYIVKWTNCSYFTVEVWVYNITKMYGFEFYLYYNSTLLNTDAQHIHIKDLLPPPYETQIIEIHEAPDPWAELDYVYIKVLRPCEKKTISCAEGPIVNIEFHTKCPTAKGPSGKPVYVLPQNAESGLDLRDAAIYSKCPLPRVYKVQDKHIVSGKPTIDGCWDGAVVWKNLIVDDFNQSLGSFGWFYEDIWATYDAQYLYVCAGYTGVGDPGGNGWAAAITLGLAQSLNIYIDSNHNCKIDNLDAAIIVLNDWMMRPDGSGYWDWVTIPSFTGSGGLMGSQNGYVEVAIPLSLLGIKEFDCIGMQFQAFGYDVAPGGEQDWETKLSVGLGTTGGLVVIDGMYYFRPNPFDLNQDGHVDLIDLGAIAKQYGKDTGIAAEFAKLAVVKGGAVDIFDVVAVAKKFCKPYTPIDPVTEEPYDP
jgi:hypothetical protein